MSAFIGPSEKIRFPYRELPLSEDLYHTCQACDNPTFVWNRFCTACYETTLFCNNMKDRHFKNPKYNNFVDIYWPEYLHNM